ncbi:class I SAM-dependent methyltransferase [Amycolatopsis azurea]|uniref:Methyltransferase type 12 n=1 Tax=Amycolatopsis azurea DSM 43854 TaxID=1238180 RepID=M2QB92_9PSEU|nr:class I SAM-dependent methyltransferase [Amycolatopsis azurea]EMD29310.1 Methyltransferase type 12 [Amycolatopsis azurea DSM 43854]OOC08104.1 hypothetical protein B0293_04315 [Amycolatopsis azurea DSM 43854]
MPESALPSSVRALTAESVMNLLTGVERAGILRAGIELRVFDALADSPRSATKVASRVGADARATEILLDALAALELLEVVPAAEGGTYYRLAPVAERFLVTTAKNYLGGLAKVYTGDYVFESFKDLAGAVRRGGTVLADNVELAEHSYWPEFAEGITATSRATARFVSGLIADRIGGLEAPSVLDVACGNGIQSFTLAEAHPGLRVTALDWANVLEVTRSVAADLGLVDRVEFLPGDMFEVPLGGPYDVVVLSHVLHNFDTETSIKLVKRLAEVVRPGGTLVVNEFLVVSPVPAEDPVPRIFSAQMLAISKGGHTYTLDELKAVLDGGGFTYGELHSLRGMPIHTVLATRR